MGQLRLVANAIGQRLTLITVMLEKIAKAKIEQKKKTSGMQSLNLRVQANCTQY